MLGDQRGGERERERVCVYSLKITRSNAGKVERVGGGDEKESEDKYFHCCCAEFLRFVHFRVCFTEKMETR